MKAGQILLNKNIFKRGMYETLQDVEVRKFQAIILLVKLFIIEIETSAYVLL